MNIKKLATLGVLALTFASFFMISATTEQSAPAGEIKWYTVEEAMAAAAKTPRKIMIDVYTKWCGPCKMMAQNTFTDPKFIEYMNANYYCVKFDAESAEPLTFKGQTFSNPDYDPNKQGRNGVHQFARYLQVSAYPTLVILDADGTYISPIVGYKTAKDLEIFMKLFATNKHKEILTQDQWTEYQKNFVGTW
ncbi:MAG: thioredoxin family protein [Flavobacteriales bacterium]|jgi:thioredoxin-related protein